MGRGGVEHCACINVFVILVCERERGGKSVRRSVFVFVDDERTFDDGKGEGAKGAEGAEPGMFS